MATDDDSPRAIIELALSRNPATVVDSSVELLQLLANGLIAIIGEEGFESLLFRSAQRAAFTFPWLQFDPRSRPADPEFSVLRRCFEDQDADEAAAGSILLFNTLIDILTVLIGDHLTTLILHSALGRARVEKNSKEQHNG